MCIRDSSNSNENVDDLFQIGCIGLIKSIDNFDVSQGVQFSTCLLYTSKKEFLWGMGSALSLRTISVIYTQQVQKGLSLIHIFDGE